MENLEIYKNLIELLDKYEIQKNIEYSKFELIFINENQSENKVSSK